MRCPFCGAENDGKFCSNCGTKIPQEQAAPAQPQIPYQQPAAQPIQQPAEQYVPIQPQGYTPIEPSAPEHPEFVPIQPVYTTPITQPVQRGPKSNGWCSSGLILSIAGWFCLGLTSVPGFICSLIGLFDSAKKHQPGRGKAIAGLILSGIVILSLGAMIAVSYNDIKRAIDEGSIESPLDIFQIMDDATDRQDTSYKKKVAAVTKIDWVEKGNMFLDFKTENTFRLCNNYKDPENYYYTGKYRIYRGNDAYRQMTMTYKKYGITINDFKELKGKLKFDSDNMVCIVLEADGYWVNGENTIKEKSTEVLYGYFADDSEDRLIVASAKTKTPYNFVPYVK